jgi:carbonic anhydrase
MGILGPNHPFPADAFVDVIAANASFAAAHETNDLPGLAARGLAILTCIDSRIDALAVTGMQEGDAFIIRNAGARVTDDVLRSIVLATTLMGVSRILVMPHTRCAMAQDDERTIHARIAEAQGVDTRSLEFRTVLDQVEALHTDVTRLRALPFLPDRVTVGGALYHVESGLLEPIDA